MVTPEEIVQRIPTIDQLENPSGRVVGEGVVASVLVPLIFTPSDPTGSCQVLFIHRSNEVRHHKGQIAFPGGRRDSGDPTVLHTALRETLEELGPQARPSRILGSLPPVITVATGFVIYPFVGMMPEKLDVQPEPREVAGVMTIPLDFFLAEGRNTPASYRYGPHIIWGATARIINQFVAFMIGENYPCA